MNHSEICVEERRTTVIQSRYPRGVLQANIGVFAW